MALALSVHFDVAAPYGLGELADAVAHAVRPGKAGTVLVRPWQLPPTGVPHGSAAPAA
ncbi:hypothetical protein [Streptomyces broussonetiae]|uniref:hypothetical protein n=1 Tax=Streptomyces broussonetiae TaxID=2686304 RepID=UPI001E2AC578|nr:hypothetical protein [Streptomyces broussonetiae]